MATEKKIKIFNKGVRFFDTKEGRIESGSFAELSEELAAKMVKAYPGEIVEFKGADQGEGEISEAGYKKQIAELQAALAKKDAEIAKLTKELADASAKKK
jgi:hypothetical protein